MARIQKRKSDRVPAHPDDKEQSRLFIEKARELGANEGHSEADRLIGHLAKKPPEPRQKIKRKSPPRR
jgi:hypothetical protein